MSKRTIERYRSCISRMLTQNPNGLNTQAIRSFLSTIENPYSYNNYVKALRTYFRDYLKRKEVIETFRLARPDFVMPRTFTKKELVEFYNHIESEKERSLFMLYATSGRRRTEILSLKMGEIDLERRSLMPNHATQTKNTWWTFFNDECKTELSEYLKVRRDLSRCEHLFPMSCGDKSTLFRMAMHKTGLPITPKVLRFWFANEMARLCVPDRFIDAFQGRIPRSVIARHYTDYSQENLKQIYDKANLQILS